MDLLWFYSVFPQCGTVDTEIKVPSVENVELVLPLKLGIGQNIAMHASPTARNFFLPNSYFPGPFRFI